MADPQQQDPWAQFNPQPAPAAGSPADSLGRPVIVRGAAPTPPTESYAPMTPQQRTAYGIPTGTPVVINQAGKPEVINIPKDNATADSLSPEALDAETTNWILTGKMSPLGMGNGPLRVQIENNRPVIMKKYGITDNALPAIQKQFDADSKAYTQRTQQISFMNQALDAATQHVQQITGYLKDLPAQTNFTPFNALSLGVQRKFSGEKVTDLDATIPLLQSEVAKIMTANPSSGAGQLTDEARREFDILGGSLAPKAKMEAMQAIMDMVNRKITGTQAESDRLNQRLNGGIQSYALGGLGAPPSTPGAGPTLGGTPPSGPPENPIANGGPGDMGPSLSPSGGSTRSVIDPKKQALGQQIVSLVSKGADPNTVMGFAVGADPTLRGDPKFRAWVSQAIQYRQQHPNAKFSIDPGFYTSEVPLSTTEKVGNAVAQSSPGAAIMNAGNAATFGNMGNITGDKEGVDRALAVANAQHPVASLAGNVAGGASAAMGIEGLLGKAGMAATPLRTMLADMGYGGVTGASNAAPGQTLQNGALGAMLGLGGNLVGRGAAKGVASALEGVTNPTVSYVARELPDALTLGQAVGQSGPVGKIVKGVEDRLTGFSGVGDQIKARQTEGLQKMNSVAFDKALEPVGGQAGGKFGEEAVQHAQGVVGQAFNKALSGKTANLDHGFIVDAARAKNAIDALPDSVKGEVNNQVDHVINNYFDDNGQITGENLQAVLQELGGVKRAYQGTPLGHRIGSAVDQLSEGVEGLFRRQAPEVMPQYDAAKQAFKRVSTLEDAVLRAKNTGGVFTPAQLGFADKANTIKYGGKHAAAAGKGEFHDFQRNMQDVLPSKVPDSGTAGRLALAAVPTTLAGAGAGLGYIGGDTKGGAETGLGLSGLLALAYSRAGQRALTSAVLKRGTSAQAAGQAVRKSARVVAHAAGTEAALGSSRD